MMFGIGIPLTVRNEVDEIPDDLFEGVDKLAEALSDLEECDKSLLDSSLSADKGEGRVIVEVTVDAATLGAAVDKALGSVRAAIHAIGDGTPGWEDTFKDALDAATVMGEAVPA
jgi:hypothetical protein